MCTEFLCKGGMLCLFAGQCVPKPGIVAKSDLHDLEGRDTAEFSGPLGIGPVEERGIIFDNEDVRAKFFTFSRGEFIEHPGRDAVADVSREGLATFACINEEVCISCTGVGGFGEFFCNHVHGFIMSLNAEGRNLWVFAFSQHMSSRVGAPTERTACRGRRSRPFVLDTVSNFGVKECSIPELHDRAPVRGRYSRVVDVSLCLREQVFFCCCPGISVNAFERGGVLPSG